jgi:hypothetical protein
VTEELITGEQCALLPLRQSLPLKFLESCKYLYLFDVTLLFDSPNRAGLSYYEVSTVNVSAEFLLTAGSLNQW